jgi:hypothetical protein
VFYPLGEGDEFETVVTTGTHARPIELDYTAELDGTRG